MRINGVQELTEELRLELKTVFVPACPRSMNFLCHEPSAGILFFSMPEAGVIPCTEELMEKILAYALISRPGAFTWRSQL